jgi:acetyl-CoA carboxylase biotin carboxyl carrier protein
MHGRLADILAERGGGDWLMELTEEDVLEILKLFEQSKFDFLQLEQGERKITVSKSGYVSPNAAAAPPLAPPPVVAPAAGPVASLKAAAPDQAAPPGPGLVAITAPMVGKFYAAPSPAEPPFVAQGSRVEAGGTVGLIEVMKVFTSIKTETAGMIERILVSNGELVEFGQTLFWLRPAG